MYNVPQAHFLQWVAPTVVPIFLRDTGDMELNLIFGSVGFGVEDVDKIGSLLPSTYHYCYTLMWLSHFCLTLMLSHEIRLSIHLIKMSLL